MNELNGFSRLSFINVIKFGHLNLRILKSKNKTFRGNKIWQVVFWDVSDLIKQVHVKIIASSNINLKFCNNIFKNFQISLICLPVYPHLSTTTAIFIFGCTLKFGAR